MANEIEVVSLVDTWLDDTLTGDSTLSGLVDGRIVGDMGALGSFAGQPTVVFTFLSSRDITAVDGTIIDTSSLYDVEAIFEGESYAPLEAIAARAHILIHRASVTFPGGGSLTCARERIIRRAVEDAGRQYRRLGGQYRIRASKD